VQPAAPSATASRLPALPPIPSAESLLGVGRELYQRMESEISSQPRRGQSPCWPRAFSGTRSGDYAHTACAHPDVERLSAFAAAWAPSFSGLLSLGASWLQCSALKPQILDARKGRKTVLLFAKVCSRQRQGGCAAEAHPSSWVRCGRAKTAFLCSMSAPVSGRATGDSRDCCLICTLPVTHSAEGPPHSMCGCHGNNIYNHISVFGEA